MLILLIVVALILAIATIFIVNKYPKSRIYFQIGYIPVIIILAVIIILNVRKPIQFEKERKIREDAAIEKLKAIRTIQNAYKDKYDKYTGSFDTLINFAKIDSFEIEKIRQVKFWNQDEIPSQKEAIRLGILKKEIFKQSVKDSLNKVFLKELNKEINYDNIRYIPYTGKKEFTMGAGEVATASQVEVKVFEAYALYEDLLNGLDEQLITNYIGQRQKITDFPGVKVGSLEEATNNAGNWEK